MKKPIGKIQRAIRHNQCLTTAVVVCIALACWGVWVTVAGGIYENIGQDGKPATAYKVMRRERPAGSWQEVATAVISEATLVEQPRGKELQYRIIVVNRASES